MTVEAHGQTRIVRPNRDGSPGRRTIRLEQVAAAVKPHDVVVIGHGSGWPKSVVNSLVTEATAPFHIVHNRIDDDLPYFTTEATGRVRHLGFMVSRQSRPHMATGRADFVPNSYRLTPQLFRDGSVDCDVVIVQVSPPDANGWHSLGTCVAYLPAAMERARVVIAQVNECMPRTGATVVHESSFDRVIELNTSLHEVDPPVADDVSRAIAAQVATLVRDGDVLQVGIGKLGDAIMTAVASKRDLRMWTETFNDTAMQLLRQGTLVAGPHGEAPITATFVTASQGLYDELGTEPGIRMLPVDHINHPAALARQENLTAINSAIEVDLSGQVNAESIGSQTYSGSGGHLDFVIGSTVSPGGRYICALPSTTRRGMSRIVARLSEGTTVTVPRSLADTVVTEYGVAALRGRSLAERAAALIAIAHPNHQASLRAGLSRRVQQ